MVTTAMIERRSELITQVKVRKLSVAEAEELKTILEKELWHSFATGEIGVLALAVLLTFIKSWGVVA